MTRRATGTLAVGLFTAACGPGAIAQQSDTSSGDTSTGDGDDGDDGNDTGSDDGGTDTGGDEEPPEPPTTDPFPERFVEGDRLAPLGFSSPSGAFEFRRYLDKEHDHWCEPGIAADGQLRCLPLGAELKTYYLDAECTQPIMMREGTWLPDPRFTQEALVPGECDTRLEVRPLTDIEENPSIVWYSFGPGSCSEWSGDPLEEDYVTVGDPLPADSFVALEPREELGDGLLGVSMLEGADGSRFTLGPLDPARGICAPQLLETGDLRCTPSEFSRLQRTGGSAHFAQSCAGPYVVEGGRCEQPRAILERGSSDDSSLLFHHVYEVGPEFFGQVTRWWRDFSDPLCEEMSGQRWWFLAGPIAPTTLAPVEARRLPGEPLGMAWVATPEGVLLAPGADAQTTGPFYDPEALNTCTVVLLEDETGVRCLPDARGIHVSNSFADPECTHALASFISFWDEVLIEVVPGQRFGIRDDDSWLGTWEPGGLRLPVAEELWEVVELYTGPKFSLEDDVCVPDGEQAEPRWTVEARPLDSLPVLEWTTLP